MLGLEGVIGESEFILVSLEASHTFSDTCSNGYVCLARFGEKLTKCEKGAIL